MSSQQIPIQSTAGAVPVRNDKGEVSMQKVKVQRYISGKRPDYAPAASSSDESELEDFLDHRNDKRQPAFPQIIKDPGDRRSDGESDKEVDDPRLRRLRAARDVPDEDNDDMQNEESRRRRHALEPEILAVATPASDEGEKLSEEEKEIEKQSSASSAESDEELEEEEIELRRRLLRQKLMSRAEEEEVEALGKEEEGNLAGITAPTRSDSDEDDDEDDDEYTDSEEDTGPRLKPVFVRAKDRLTIIEREKAAQKQKQTEVETKKEKEERRREALRLVEETVRREQQERLKMDNDSNINDVCTDDENDEVEYEAWKLREMKRIKRDKEEREALEKEAMEIEKYRGMTDEDRRLEQRVNPKQITNKAYKGKYKFLQKYYHRGAFYLDREEEVLKQDFSGPTLDDHFDKSVLPKVMQVKKFGRSGRTKYTHLVDQDTTQFDSPWCGETLPQNAKFHATARAGTKNIFEKPSNKRKYQ